MAYKDGRSGITAYLEANLLKRTKIYMIMSDKMPSEIIEESLNEYLDKRNVPKIPSSDNESKD